MKKKRGNKHNFNEWTNKTNKYIFYEQMKYYFRRKIEKIASKNKQREIQHE